MWKILSEFLVELREWWEYRPKYAKLECPNCGCTHRRWISYYDTGLFCTYECWQEYGKCFEEDWELSVALKIEEE